MRVLRTIAVIAIVGVLAASCTGSGSKQKSSANDFVDAACADLAAWATSVNTAFTDLQSLGAQFSANDTTAAQLQLKKVSQGLESAEAATSQLANGISARGAPSIASGEDIKKSILDSLNRLRELLNTTRKEVDTFDFATATKEASDRLKSDLDALTSEVASAFAGLAPLNENNDLRTAFEGSAACKKVQSSFSS
jgi:hypothetical protein